MSLCVVDGKHCRCQPDEGVPCSGVVALRAEVERLRAQSSYVSSQPRMLNDDEVRALAKKAGLARYVWDTDRGRAELASSAPEAAQSLSGGQ